MPRMAIYRQIIMDITTAIERGELKPGTKLPTIEELRTQYECSATPVKFALRLLDQDGIIETRHGVGSFVTDRKPHGNDSTQPTKRS